MEKLPLQTSIVATLAYSSIFQYPLRLQELVHRLVGLSDISERRIKNALSQLKNVELTRGFLVFKGERQLVTVRSQRRMWTKRKWAELERISKYLGRIPGVQAVYVTGALAMDNPKFPHDDIDLMIVTKQGWLWLSRLMIIPWFMAIGKYRGVNSGRPAGWCVNLWLEEDALKIPKKKQSLYVAYEILQSKQILGTKNMLLAQNSWIKEYSNCSKKVSNSLVKRTRTSPKTGIARPERSRRGNWVIGRVNILAYWLQQQYMRLHQTTEQVEVSQAYFHPRDTRGIIWREWEGRLQRLKINDKEIALIQKLYLGKKIS